MVCAIGLLLSLLAGCGPDVGGAGAVRLDAEQGLVGVFGLCNGFGELSTITLYASKVDGELGDPVIELERAGPAPAGRVVEVPLQAPPAPWHARAAASELDPGLVYELRAWNKDGMSTVASFPFRIGELRDRPDTAKSVLTKAYSRSKDGRERYDATFSTPEGFHDLVTGRCGAA